MSNSPVVMTVASSVTGETPTVTAATPAASVDHRSRDRANSQPSLSPLGRAWSSRYDDTEAGNGRGIEIDHLVPAKSVGIGALMAGTPTPGRDCQQPEIRTFSGGGIRGI